MDKTTDGKTVMFIELLHSAIKKFKKFSVPFVGCYKSLEVKISLRIKIFWESKYFAAAIFTGILIFKI